MSIDNPDAPRHPMISWLLRKARTRHGDVVLPKRAVYRIVRLYDQQEAKLKQKGAK